MKVKISVTEQDIKEGRNRSASYCPIAKAVKRALNMDTPTIGRDWISLYENSHGIISGKKIKTIPLPEIACQFRHDFDNNLPVAPIEFEIEV